ncbi:hypothetical protein BSKO_02047 [Bryopsis sp. KO-2023]|nr:hypothetical protein BSKO_02047 [Bryopsis sp. KO-2023]
MAKKTRGVDIRSHQHHLLVAKREAEKFKARMEKRKQKRDGDVVMKDKPKKKTLRYRRNMRIGGVAARNKAHAKELWKNKYGKRERPDEEMEVEAEVRSKKRRKVQAKEDSDDFSAIGVDGMGLETGTMKTYMTLGSK